MKTYLKNHNSLMFTLIELMVVVAILAILASMLLPALSKVRDNAKQIQCINNQKQLLFAMQNYTDDYNDYLYAMAVDNWYDALAIKTDYLKKNTNLVVCPAVAPFTFVDHYETYGNRGNVTLWSGLRITVGTDTFINTKKITKPSSCFNIGDSIYNPLVCSAIRVNQQAAYVNFGNTPSSLTSGFYMAHRGKINLGFFDGHVDNVSSGDYWGYAVADNPPSGGVNGIWVTYFDQRQFGVSKYVRY
ncbi:MAG: type II secretion system protein [Lentisphaerota bacterium]